MGSSAVFGAGPGERARPSPNIWNWPDVYEIENRAQDCTGAIRQALRQRCDWSGADVVDVGCGDGFHLPMFAATARSVVGIEPHPPLVRRARRRLAALERSGGPRVPVQAAPAQRLPLESACADLVHARTAYFFGPGCEPGMSEARRVLRPGGTLAIVDLDATRAPYGDWMRADLPDYRPGEVEEFFTRAGFDSIGVDTLWRFDERASLEAVLRIEFSAEIADRAIRETSGNTVAVSYRLRFWKKELQPLGGA